MIEVEQIFINSYGDLENFNWAVTHQTRLMNLIIF